MNNAQQSAEFEHTLSGYAALCVSVAFALTGSSSGAQALARDVLGRAWRNGAGAYEKERLKSALLIDLRETFLAGHRAPAA